jgi:cellobiose epimerase
MLKLLRKCLLYLLPLLLLSTVSSFPHVKTIPKNSESQEGIQTNKDTIEVELKHQLDEIFKLWYPLTIDKQRGGYYSDVDYKWELKGPQNKMIVTQARRVWSNANASIFFKTKEPYFKDAEQGYKFLRDVMWDKKYGGFYDLVDREGKQVSSNYGPSGKTAYGNAFAIYGLSAYYKAFGDKAALDLAIKTFNWMEKHSYDPQFGGYFQNLSESGKAEKGMYHHIPPKDQNSMIHIMEAFTELYTVWPNKLLEERLNSLFHLVRDTVIGNKGYMTLFFKRDWTPISYKDSSKAAFKRGFELDHISFGHDVETAYLLLETSKVMGIKNDTTTLRIAKQLDDFALANGWDKQRGGIYDGGYIFKGSDTVKIVRDTKEWWSQIEALNSFLMMSKLFPDDPHDYYNKFCIQWNYIKKYLIDQRYGGFYWDSIDTNPKSQNAPKGTIWKADYHTSRGLINCIRRLDGEL